MEKSFLGENASLVNLDSLMAALPPPTLAPTSSLNPFATPSLSSTATPPLARAQNPFEVNKPPAPSINQLRGGPTDGFGKIPTLTTVILLYVVIIQCFCAVIMHKIAGLCAIVEER